MSTNTSNRTGRPNYNNEILYACVARIVPTSTAAWEIVADEYREAAGETESRNVVQLKKHWNGKCCAGFKKVTGKGSHNEFITKCQTLAKAMLNKKAGQELGGSSDDDYEFADDDPVEFDNPTSI